MNLEAEAIVAFNLYSVQANNNWPTGGMMLDFKF